MKALFILNDPPYGTERSFNGLRLAKALRARRRGDRIPDGGCGRLRQGRPKVPQGYYNLELMVKSVARKGACCCAAPAWTRAD